MGLLLLRLLLLLLQRAAWLLLLLKAALAAPLQGLPQAAPLQLQILGRTIVCSAILPLTGLEHFTTPLALTNQQLSLLGRT